MIILWTHCTVECVSDVLVQFSHTYRVFGNEGYTESGYKLINSWPNLDPNAFFAFTINIRFHLLPLKGFTSIVFLYFKNLFLSQNNSPLEIISVLSIMKKEPWNSFSNFWSGLWFSSFEQPIQCWSLDKLWF